MTEPEVPLVVEGLLVDIDGVLRVDDTVIPGAAEALALLRSRGFALRFLTNTSVRSRASLHQNLVSLGLPVRLEELFTAPVATAAYLRATGRRRIFLLIKGDVVDDFQDFERVNAGAEAVVVGGAEEEFTYQNVNRAFQLLLAGAELVAIHRNRFWQTAHGPWIDAGAYVAGLEYAAGVPATLIGKPSRHLFDLARADLGLRPEQILVVGDDLESDVGGGRRLGARTALVQTGKFRPSDLTRDDLRPDLVLRSIAALPAAVRRLEET